MSKLTKLCDELIREDYFDDYERFTKGVMQLAKAAKVMEAQLKLLKKEDVTYIDKNKNIQESWDALAEVNKIINE